MSPTQLSAAGRMRQLLRRPGAIRSLGAHDVFSALLIERAGFDMLFVGGFGTSASLLGMPDLDLLTLTEMADQVRRMCARLTVPLIADGDTGHGDLHNVGRTVREFEGAGAAGVIIEDQVSPKRCGHFEGKHVVGSGEMVRKLRAAKEAQRDDDFVLVARTDAREVLGLEEAIHRANLYGDSGADVVFIEAPHSVGELQEIAGRVRYPMLVNMLFGGKTPLLTVAELERMGFKIVVAPIESLLVTAAAVLRLAETYRDTGSVLPIQDAMVSFDEIKRILGVQDLLRPPAGQ